MLEIRYETPMECVDFGSSIPSIFLAGPTVRGNQPHLVSWRFKAVELLKAEGFDGTVIIPEFTDKTMSDKSRYDLPVWENFGLKCSTVIMFWVARTREQIALTTNYELGRWVAKAREKIVYGRPDDAYRIAYGDIMWVQDAKERTMLSVPRKYCPSPIYTTLEKTVKASVELCSKLTRPKDVAFV